MSGTQVVPYPHGTRYGYVSLRCSCDPCCDANTVYQRGLKAKLRAQGLPDGDLRHGTHNGYSNHGCRCVSCTEANRQAGIEYRERQTTAK